MYPCPIHQQSVTMESENYETTCWGCGLCVVLPSPLSVSKCGWCGAITNQNKNKYDKKKHFRWRLLLNRCTVSIVIMLMLFVIFGGLWAVAPTVFSISVLCGIFHSTITAILSIATLSSFSLAAFRSAGTPENVLWGSYPAVTKGGLEDYTFCYYCSKPKPPGTHHCRSCANCIVDMDHHCPFIGNCVGAANRRSFIAFLISAVVSTMYVAVMCGYTTLHLLPPIALAYPVEHLNGTISDTIIMRIFTEIILAYLSCVLLLSSRGLVLVFLFILGASMHLGLSVILWQQLYFIYVGETYLSHLSSQADHNRKENKDCQNLVRFFGFPYSVKRLLPNFIAPKKISTKVK